MSSRRWGEAGPASGKAPPMAVVLDSPQPPRILVVDLHPPHWGHTCPKLCQALENVFALACGLAGPPRVPLFSLYMAQSQQECLLPFLPVRGGFARLQSCLVELQASPAEGVFWPSAESPVVLAVQDGLQQFKQYTGCGMAGSSFSNSAVEVTVLTSQCGREVARQLEAGLQNIDLAHLRQLQVVEISKEGSQEPLETGEGERDALSGSSGSNESGPALGTDIALLAVENKVLALEMFFKAWFHDHSGNQEHLHLLLPSRGEGVLGYSAMPVGNLVCVKCDLQERILNPAMLLPTGKGRSSSMAEAHEAFASSPRATPSRRLAPRRLRVIRALKASGLCASLLFGPSLVVLPTSCWQLNWDELEANQHRFQALCHGLWEREWVLLARDEAPPPGGHGPTWSLPDAALQALLPSESGALLLRSVVAQELLLPCTFPTVVAPTDPPEAERQCMEVILNSLGVEATYNPLSSPSPLYRALKQSLGRALTPRPPRPAERHLPPRQQANRGHGSKARAMVPPLRMVAPLSHLSFSSSPEEEFQDPPK